MRNQFLIVIFEHPKFLESVPFVESFRRRIRYLNVQEDGTEMRVLMVCGGANDMVQALRT